MVLGKTKPPPNPKVISLKVAIVVDEFQRAQEMETIHKPTDTRPTRWTPTLMNVVKMNIDTTIFTMEQAFGIGIIIKDSNGQFQAAKSYKLFGDVDTKWVEIIALKEGLIFV